MNKISLISPDDWHCHLRDEACLARTVYDVSQYFKRAIIMPNLTPPVTAINQAKGYLARIQANIPPNKTFTPLMTLYLTEQITPKIIQQAQQSQFIHACKLYPAGATTHSAAGIANIKNIYSALEAMQKADLPLLIHGEVIDETVDIFDREAAFIERELIPITEKFPNLRIVLEHVSTKEGVQFVQSCSHYVAATVTPHHLLLNRNHLLAGGLKPHHYCLPVLKRQEDQAALVKAVTTANTQFFLGTDSAPHSIINKESSCGCAGIYNMPSALAIYTYIFETNDALDQLEKFTSINGPQFYRLPINKTKITLIKKPWRVPSTLPFGKDTLVPFCAEQTLNWQIQTSEQTT